MTQHSIDPERMAALLDGRLEAQARDQLLAELANSEDGLGTLSDTAALLRNLELAEASPDVVPAPDHAENVAQPAAVDVVAQKPLTLLSSTGDSHDATKQRRQRTSSPRSWAIAAALVGIVGIGLWYRSTAATGRLNYPADMIALLNTPEGVHPAPVAWSTTRGPADRLSASARGVRFGARATEIEIAARSRDASTVARLAAEMATLLNGAKGSGLAVQLYEQIATTSQPVQVDQLRERWDTAITLLDRESALLGAWLVTAREAVAQRDGGFFQKPGSRDVIRSLGARIPSAPSVERQAVGDLESLAQGATPSSWDALDRALTTLLNALAN